jgi:translation initiation factor 3 subunit B
MPFGDNNTSKGYCFIEFDSSQSAYMFLKTFNKFALDKKHTLTVMKITDIEKYVNLPDEFSEPLEEKYT